MIARARIGKVGLAVLAVAVLLPPAASASPEREQRAGAQAAGKQVKKLKRKVKRLNRQVRELRRTVADLPGASGPAGGALTGSYPNPLVAPGAIASPEVADDSLTGADIVESTLLSPLLRNWSEHTEASGLTTTDEKTVNVTCPAGKRAIGGGARAGNIVFGPAHDVAVTGSYPPGASSWRAQAREVGPGAGEWFLIAHVICADY